MQGEEGSLLVPELGCVASRYNEGLEAGAGLIGRQHGELAMRDNVHECWSGEEL